MYPLWQRPQDTSKMNDLSKDRTAPSYRRVSSSGGDANYTSNLNNPWVKDLDTGQRKLFKSNGDYGDRYYSNGVGSEGRDSVTKLKSPTLNKDRSSLWNRRKTNSATNLPTAVDSVGYKNNKNMENNNRTNDYQNRGTSASPVNPQSTGFWLQHPEDSHQQWVKTESPKKGEKCTSDSGSSTFTWPRRMKSHDDRLTEDETMSSLPRIYKSQALWVMTPEPDEALSKGDTSDAVSSQDSAATTPNSGEVKDFKKRLQLFQSADSKPFTPQNNNTKLVDSVEDVSTNENCLDLQQNYSMSDLNKLKSSMSEVKSTIDEIKSSSKVNFSSSSNIQKSSSSQSKIQQSSQSKSQVQQSSKTTTSSKSLKSCSTNSLQLSSENIHLSDNLQALSLTNSELGDPSTFLQDPSNLLASQGAVEVLGGSTGSLNGSGLTVTKKVKNTSSSSTRKITSSSSNILSDGSGTPEVNTQSSETASSTSSKSTRVQAGDQSYSEYHNTAAAMSKTKKNGVTEEKEAALEQEGRQFKKGDDISHTEEKKKMGGTVKVSGDGFKSEKSAVCEQDKIHSVTPAGTISSDSTRMQRKASNVTVDPEGITTTKSSSMSSSESNISISGFEELDLISGNLSPMDIQNAIMKYSGVMTKFVDQLKNLSPEGFKKAPSLLEHMNDMIRRAWSVPTIGHELGYSLCSTIRLNGGLDILLDNCTSDDSKLKFSSAKVLEQCLTTENRGYVVENGLESIVNAACDCTQENDLDQSRVGTGILEHLFKHSEGTCSDIIKMGGLEAVVRECRTKDVETLRHCAGALANLSLYGGSENQQAMVQEQVAIWLFPLAFHLDDNIKYYACLAIAALVANTEIEAQVLKADTLSLIEPFVSKHLPEEFANSTVAHKHGQSRDWLQKLVPVLSSKREEARNLAAFHFCMEAGIKKNQGNLDIFREINAIEPLKQVASSPNAIASKYAAHALRLMGEEVPHKLSQQVPLWRNDDVQEWVKQIGFEQYADAFVTSRVDGDLLLRIGEDNLHYDIGITNGILRRRFLRELKRLREIADYSSKDPTGLNSFLSQLGQEYANYTYQMLQTGVSKHTLRYLTDEQLVAECGIVNSIHRQRIREGIIDDPGSLQDPNQLDKNLDVFISYRRSNGSQLASLLKVHMQLRGFSVFIDVERLEAGKFDNNLLNSIRQAKNFLLVLTPNALDRCNGDNECKDWVHKEIVAALESNCNIIPITDDFHWPDPEQLPEDMRAVSYFNGVRWIHDYQDACVEKLERFMRGESVRGDPPGSLGRYQSTSALTQPGTPSPLPRGLPVYNRTTSTESGKGSSCSDKDFISHKD